MRKFISMAILAVPFLAIACTTQIDGNKLQDDIKADGQKNNITYKTVTCPQNQVAKAGGSFKCDVTDDQGTAGTYTVNMTDASGSIEYKLDQKYMDMKKVGDDLESKLKANADGQSVDVKCPAKNVLIKKGVSFSCDCTVGSDSGKAVVTATDDDGTADIEFKKS